MTSNTNDINTVNEAVAQLRQAMLSADGDLLSSLAHEELTYGHSGGQIQNKQEFVDTFTSGASVFTSIDISDQNIRIAGDTAIVRHILKATTNDKGKGPGNVNISILLVWIKGENNSWKLLARQAVRV